MFTTLCKKRGLIRRFFFLFTAILLVAQGLGLQVNAKDSLTITAPVDGTFISKKDFDYLRWTAVDGAVGYRVTIVDGLTGELYSKERNLWVGNKTKYAIGGLLEDLPEYPLLKIWVGAMSTASDEYDINADVISWAAIYVGVAEAPQITNDGSSHITATGATLKMTVERNYGSAIADAGFYIGTSSNKNTATKYSFHDHGPSSVQNNDQMTMEVTSLEPNKKYYYWAYAENGVGETTSDYKTFRTDEDFSEGLTLSKSAVSFAWGVGDTDAVTVDGAADFEYSVEYDVPASILATEYNYQWLAMEREEDTLYFMPSRANFADVSRKATVTITAGGQSKTVTVTQNKCGEAAPAITLKRAGKTVTDGFQIGTFPVWTAGEAPLAMQIDWTAQTNVRRIYASVFDINGNERYGVYSQTNPANSGLISIDISNCPAGEYKLVISVSNSDTANDYWKQSPFGSDSITLYFTLTGHTASTGYLFLDEWFENQAEEYILDTHLSYVQKAIAHHLKDADVKVALEEGKCAVFFFDGCSVNLQDKDIYFGGFGKFGEDETVWKTISAVCIVIKYDDNNNPVIAFVNKDAATLADNVRSDRSRVTDYTGCMTVLDGKYGLVLTTHKGYAGFQIRDLYNSNNGAAPILRATGWHITDNSVAEKFDFSTELSTDNTKSAGANLHARKNAGCLCSLRSADSGGCFTVGETIPYTYDSPYTYFVREVSGYSNINPLKVIGTTSGGTFQYETHTYDDADMDKNCGVLIVDRSCYMEGLPKIFGDDTVAGGIENLFEGGSNNGVATGEDIAREITRNSVAWRREFMGDSDPMVKKWDLYDGCIEIPGTPGGPTIIEKFSVRYDANGGRVGTVPEEKIVEKGEAITISSVVPTYAGYRFLGWALSPGATRADFVAGDTYTVNAETIFYAVWEKLDAIEIIRQPRNATAPNGRTVCTWVEAEGEGLQYQWYYQEPDSSVFHKSSVTGNIYDYRMTDAKSGRRVYCVITDRYGNEVKTKTVTLSNLAITTQPKDATAANGKTISVTVKAEGQGLQYQWYHQEPDSSVFHKSSVTGNIYDYRMTAAKSGRQVYCVITDKWGNSVKTEVVTLSNLAITTQPKDATAANGKTISVTVKAEGQGLKYQWYCKNPGGKSFGKSSITSATYSYAMTAAKSGRQVYCVITDKWGNTVKTNVVTLLMINPAAMD